MRTCGFTYGLGLLLCAAALDVPAMEPVAVAGAPLARAVRAPAKAMVTEPAAVDGFGPGVSGSALATLRGGTEVTERMTLNGTVSNNSADEVVTGYNTIGGSAFNGASGLPMVIQNSGNNVLIQNATIVNVQFQP